MVNYLKEIVLSNGIFRKKYQMMKLEELNVMYQIFDGPIIKGDFENATKNNKTNNK